MGIVNLQNCFDENGIKNLLFFLNAWILFAQTIIYLLDEIQPHTLISLILVIIIIIYQALSFLIQTMRNQQILYFQVFILTILHVEINLQTYQMLFLQVSFLDVFFIERKETSKKQANLLFLGMIFANSYVFVRIGFFASSFMNLIFTICESILLKLLLWHLRNERDKKLKNNQDSQKLNQIEIDQINEKSVPRSVNLEYDYFDSQKLFKTFDVLPEGIIILDKSQKEEFQMIYSNKASKLLLDQELEEQMLLNLLELKGVSNLQKSEEHLYKYSFSIQSQQSVKRSSYKILSKPPSFFKQAFKFSQQFILENQNLQQKQDFCIASNTMSNHDYIFQFPPVSIVFPNMHKSELNHPNSPSIHYATPGRKSQDDCDSFSYLLNQIWSQLNIISKEKINNHQNQPIFYVHESDIFVTNLKTQNKKQFLDLKVFSAIHLEKPLLLIILRDVNHKAFIKLLKDHNSKKSKILSFVSHEFRTPLTCIISMLEAVQENKQNINPNDQCLIQSALDNSKYILNLSNDLLDLAQIKAGKFKIYNQILDLKNLLKECLNMFEIQAQKKNIQLNFYYDKYLPAEICSDKNRIRQITVNLMGNAMKFTLEGSITLKAYLDGPNDICIEVKDTGVGMREEDQPKLIKAFAKIENKETSQLNAQGVGLGLLISNSIAQQINLEQKGLGFRSVYQEGTTFCFLITNIKIHQNTEIENYEDSQVEKEGDLETKLNDFRRLSQNEKKFILQKSLCQCSQILLVEDNQFNIDSFILKFNRTFQNQIKLDYTISGQLAEQKVQQRFSKSTHICHPYKLIFMDVEMPIQNGLITSKNIRNFYKTMNEKIIIVGCSGYAQENEKQECLKYMDDYIVKPVTKQELERIMNTHFFK